jgi:ribose 5-phosphate isomerase A
MGRPGSAAERVEQKQRAGMRAAELVADGMTVGLGSGSTAEQFVRALGQRAAAGARFRCVASSGRTTALAREVGLEIVELDGPLDLAIDGADAIERDTLRAIKGLGGALTREKLVALAARTFVLIADDSKLTPTLAERPDLPAPIEVLTFGWQLTRQRLAAFGEPTLRERDGAPFVTDNGNLILDLYHADLAQPELLAETLNGVPGVVAHGLFLGIASSAIIASEDGVLELTATPSG